MVCNRRALFRADSSCRARTHSHTQNITQESRYERAWARRDWRIFKRGFDLKSFTKFYFGHCPINFAAVEGNHSANSGQVGGGRFRLRGVGSARRTGELNRRVQAQRRGRCRPNDLGIDGLALANGDRLEGSDVEMRVVPVVWRLSGPAHVRAIQARSAITPYDRVKCLSGKKWLSPQCVSFSPSFRRR
jgi:hypothetical protein